MSKPPYTYTELLRAAYDKIIEQELKWQEQLRAFFDPPPAFLPGERPCGFFLSHEMWFGLMAFYGQPVTRCPGCGAAL